MVRFLQISDIHYQFSDFNTERLRDALLLKLDEIQQDSPIEGVFITGDIAHQGKECTEFTAHLIKNILSSTGIDIEQLHIVPGNHDLERKLGRSTMLDGVYSKSNASDFFDELIKDESASILTSFNKFNEFHKSIKDVDYPLDTIHHFYSNGVYNLILLNTSLTCYRDGQEGQLVLGKHALYNLLIENKEALNDVNKINIVIGHHTLECLSEFERNKVMNLFEDFKIDLYLAGHVHKPRYFFTVNGGEFAFPELTCGALFEDDYANPGFTIIDVNLQSYDCLAHFYMWNSEHDYWTTNNLIGKRAPEGKLRFSLEKKKIINLEEEAIQGEIDEDEFKEFIIEFHENVKKAENYKIDLDKQNELEDKFLKMLCGQTFKKQFDKFTSYFEHIDTIMNSTAYISSDKKEVVSDIIIHHYLAIHNNYASGDQIFVKLTEKIYSEYSSEFNYSKNKLQRYIKILICWSIFECNIYNDVKNTVIN